MIRCSNRWKDSLHKKIGSSSIQYHKNWYITDTSNEYINRYLKRKCSEEPGMSQVKDLCRRSGNRRSFTKIFDFKKQCIIYGENCNIFKDKKHPDQCKNNKAFHCRTVDWGKGNLSSKETLLQVNNKGKKICSPKSSVGSLFEANKYLWK